MKKRRLSNIQITGPGEPKKTRQTNHQHDDEALLFPDSGYSGSQENDANRKELVKCEDDEYYAPRSTSPGAAESCSAYPMPQERGVVAMDVDESDEDDNQCQLSPLTGTGDTGSYRYRDFAENHLYCTIEIGYDVASKKKKEKKKIKREGTDATAEDSTKETLLKQCNALLNSGGGVLEMTIANFQDSCTSKQDPFDSFWKTVEPHLRGMIAPSIYGDVFDLEEKGDKALLFINAPKHFCTMRYNLYLPGDAGNYEASYENVIKLQEKKSRSKNRVANSKLSGPLGDLPKLPEEFKYQEAVNLKESKQIQLKNYKCETALFTTEKHGQIEGIKKQLSAFGNGKGGIILLGIEDDRKVCGIDMEKNSREDIEEKIGSLVDKVCCNLTPQRGIHWNIQFFPLSGCEISKAVVAIKMAGIQNSGGVFAKCPESYEIRRNEDGQKAIHRLNFEEWEMRMMSDLELQGNSKGMEQMISKFQKLHLTKGHLLTVKGDVQKIRDAFFKVVEGFPITPGGIESNLPKEAQAVIQQIQKECRRDRNRGLLAISHSWSRDTGGTAIDNVICDVLLVSRDMGGLHLYTLCREVDEESLLYSKETALSIKKSLSENGARGEKFYVSYHVLSCSAGVEVELPSPDVRYPKCYDMQSSREKLNEILKAMVVTAAAVPSTLSGKLGVTILNLLTKKQFQLVHQQIDVNRELWIKGVAGTGKTLVAVEFMRELRRREKLERDHILYVCENEGIANQVRKSNLCNAVCRQTFIDHEFPGARHVVLDEVHNYEQPELKGSWYEKAKRLVRQHDPARPGYLWCFIDMCQKTHDFPSGIPDDSLQQPHFRLRKVIRNSTKIFKHAKQYLVDPISKDKVKVGHDFPGEDVKTIPYRRREQSQLDVLSVVLRQLLADGYSERDVTVLFLKQDKIPDWTNLSRKLHDFSLTSARENDSDKLVISTVLKYSGLERPVVVLVDVHGSTLWKRKRESFLYCAVTRGMVKLVIIQCY